MPASNEKSQRVRPETQREYPLFHALDVEANGLVEVADFERALADNGLQRSDGRLAEVYAALDARGGEAMDLQDFSAAIASASVLVERALRGELTIPDFPVFRERVEEIFATVRGNRSGDQARYIPPLAEVDPDKLGVAVVTADGQVLTIGDAFEDFSIQSTCKPFNYCFALEELGEEAVHQHIGREPSGQRFNAYVLQDSAKPHNPMINAGAIMCAALIKRSLPLHKRLQHVQGSWARLTGRAPRFNAYMAQEENRTGDRNRALAYMMKNEGSFPNGDDAEDHEIRSALELYFRCCSLEMNCIEIATAAATMANGGVCPLSEDRVLQRSTVRSCLSLMHSCGMYDYSGEFAFSIGLPAKSGVGGAVLLVVPQLMGICIWSPRLDPIGNSARGVDFARRLTDVYGLHIYDVTSSGADRIDPRISRARRQARTVSTALWAASTGDVRALRRMQQEKTDLDQGDYDGRTALHVAAAEGHEDVVELLLRGGVQHSPKDRWGGTPLDDATRAKYAPVVAILTAHGAQLGKGVHIADDRAVTDASGHHGDPEAVVALLWAAANGDLTGLRPLVAQGVPVHAADYDGRTALHIAAAEGQLDAAQYLLSHGHPRSCRDRWGSTPLDEARREGRAALVGLLEPPAA